MTMASTSKSKGLLLDSEGEEIELVGQRKRRKPSPPKAEPESKRSQVASSSKAVSSFFAPRSASTFSNGSGSNGKIYWKPPLPPLKTCVIGDYQDALQSAVKKGGNLVSGRRKIAAYDLDGTLIQTASGKAAYAFSDENDWKIWGRSPNERKAVATKLKEESEAGSLILIITSQKGLDAKVARYKVWKARLNRILQTLDVPAMVIVSHGDDAYRKPNAGWTSELRRMWTEAGGKGDLDIEWWQGDAATEASRSFFVGDAAGRPAGCGVKTKDFADTDRKLAHNLGWHFLTPEEYFANEPPAKFHWSGYRPDESVSVKASDVSTLATLREKLVSSTDQTLLILVGVQASGKSRFASRLEEGGEGKWKRVNQDTLKSRDACLRATDVALKEGLSVIIDNTNPLPETRKLYLNLAEKHSVPVRLCLQFDVSVEAATHNEHFRSRRWYYGSPSSTADSTPPSLSYRPIPKIAMMDYQKRLVPPAMAEGFTEEVIKVGFVFDGTEEERRAWMMWYS